MRLNSITQFKALVGQEVICIPTGNAARGRDNNYFETKTEWVGSMLNLKTTVKMSTEQRMVPLGQKLTEGTVVIVGICFLQQKKIIKHINNTTT